MSKFRLRILFDRRKETRTDAKKEAPLSIEVREIGTTKKRFFDTKIRLKRNEYSSYAGLTINNRLDAYDLKREFLKIYKQFEEFIYSPKCLSLESISDWHKRGESLSLDFIDFFKFYMDNHATTKSVRQNFQSLLTRLEQFGQIIDFKDLTYNNIANFDLYLKRSINEQSVIYKRHNTLKRIILDANYRGLTDTNPYLHFNVTKGKSKEAIYLSREEVQRVIDYKPINSSLGKVKDMFIFQSLTGLAFIDMQKFNKDYITECDGTKTIYGKRNKSNIYFEVPINPIVENLIEKYKYKFPTITNQKYNSYLKILALHCNINKNITTHTGRHCI